ncbi:uncharacterized protein VTP21DRAFT_6527 [Calcarisporiella thermophila]|uniref:uncharacterized protein n=1 Tax=Calcarisporiella thermophila TaxID=911321 RepID=UPI003743D0D6
MYNSGSPFFRLWIDPSQRKIPQLGRRLGPAEVFRKLLRSQRTPMSLPHNTPRSNTRLPRPLHSCSSLLLPPFIVPDFTDCALTLSEARMMNPFYDLNIVGKNLVAELSANEDHNMLHSILLEPFVILEFTDTPLDFDRIEAMNPAYYTEVVRGNLVATFSATEYCRSVASSLTLGSQESSATLATIECTEETYTKRDNISKKRSISRTKSRIAKRIRERNFSCTIN